MQRWIGAFVCGSPARGALLLCALLAVGCTRTSDGTTTVSTPASPSASASETAARGTLRVATQRSPNTLNPILSANTTEGFIGRLAFDPLVTSSADGKETVPILAAEVPTEANGGISKDGLTITYHLRSGVKWQDGVPFTSRDVAFTWRAIMSPANNVITRNGYDQVASVATPDDTTVVFHLKRKFAPFVNTVFGDSDQYFEIVPEHILGKEPNVNHVAFNELPIGTGAFRVTKWVRGDHVEFVANDSYFRGKPKLAGIVVREIPDENTSINALRSHDVDWMFEASPQTINELKPLDAAKIINLVKVNMPQTYRVFINTSRTDLHDVRVRQALAYAIDKKALVDRLTGGTAVVATADQPISSPFYEPNVTTYTLDVAKAKSLLRAAGYTYAADGSAQKNGRPLSLEITYNVENATRRNIAVQMQAELKAIGIDAPVKSYPANLYFATFGQGGILTNAKYDLAISGWIAGADPDDSSLYGCDQFPPKGNNYSRYCSAEMTALQKAALDTYDRTARKKAYADIQKLLARDLPDIDLWYPVMLQPISPAFKHFDPNPVTEAWQAYEWEL